MEPPQSSAPTRHQLLLGPLLPQESQKSSPDSDEPPKPELKGNHKPREQTGFCDEALDPGLVDIQKLRAIESSASSKQPAVKSKKAPIMDAQKVVSLFQDDMTTVMIRNIPNRYASEELLHEVIMAGFDGMFDFFYLPMDFKTRRNRGYGFINFRSSSVAKEFALSFHNRQLNLHMSKKVMEVAPAATQGFRANYSKFCEKGSARIKNDWFRPMLFTPEAFELD